MDQPHALPLAQDDEAPPAARSPRATDPPSVGFDLRLLESFVTLASELHFGRAAERLAFAQPALSQQIRRLETQLGSALFTRNSRRVELTAAGKAFLAHARVSVAAAIDAGEAAAASKRITGGHLPLSLNGDALEYTRDVLRAFTVAHPDVDLDVRLHFDDESRAALERHAVDASILWADHRPPRGFESTSALLATNVAGIAVRRTHPLAEQPGMTLDRLDGQRLVMFPRARATELYDHLLDLLGGPARFSSIHHITTIGQGVAADMLSALDDGSVTPSPRWANLAQAPQGFVCRPLIPAATAGLWLVWTGAATRPTRALAAFANRVTPTRTADPGLTLVTDR